MAYRACGNNIAGSLAFSVGLVLVCVMGSELYTGKIGYAKPADWPEMAIMLLINLSTAAAMGAIAPGGAPDKLAIPIGVAFLRALLCGVLVFAAVEGWSRTRNVISIVLPTAIFVLIGGEHCVADAFWISAAGAWGWGAAGWLAVVVIGNSLGAVGARVITGSRKYDI